MRRAAALAAFIAAASNLAAAEPSFAGDWPQALREASVEGCMEDALAHGLTDRRASEVCTCFVDAVENEWPRERFDEYIALADQRATSSGHQKLAELARQCRIPSV